MMLLKCCTQFSSVPQSCLTLCDPMECSTSGFPVHYQLPELAQTHVHQVGDVIQPSHPLSPFSSLLNSANLSGCSSLLRKEFSSVAQSCLTLCNPMNCSMPGLPVHHQLPKPPKPMSIESVMPFNYLILCHPLLLLRELITG